MKLQSLRENVKSTIARNMNIKQSLSVMNIPKQSFLDKGDLVMLLDDEGKTLSMEWLKDGHYHVELKTLAEHSIISEVLKNVDTRIFETTSFDTELDKDYVIDYKHLEPETKNKIKKLVKEAETIFEKRFSQYGRGTSKKVWLRSIQLQNGNFTEWCKEKGLEVDRIKCIKEAYKEAEKTNDHLLKRRAAFAKCFMKISEKRKK